MSYPKNIAKLRPIKGMISDIAAYEVGADYYTAARNMQFRNGFAGRTLGHTSRYATPQAEIRSLLNFQYGGQNWWMYHGIDSSYVVTGTSHTDVTISGGLSTVNGLNTWTVGLLNGVPFANNGIDPPMYWDFNIANPMVELPNWPASTSCYSMRAYKYYLIAMNISAASEYHDQILWSNAAEPGAVPTTWTAAATNDAGDNILAETPGVILDGQQLDQRMILAKQHATYGMEYVGGNEVFTFYPVFTTTGVLTRNCMCPVGNGLVMVTDGDVILTTMNETKSIIDKRMRQYLFGQMDPNNYQATHCAVYPRKNEVWIAFPSTGSTYCDQALIWDYANDAWGVRDLPNTSCMTLGLINDSAPSDFWDDDSDTWDSDHTVWNDQNFSTAGNALVLGVPDDATPTDSLILEVDSGITFDGSDITASVGKYSMSFDSPDRVKGVRKVIPYVQADAGVAISCRVGSQMNAAGSISWTAAKTFTVGTDTYLNFDVQGKFISVEFSTTTGKPWVLVGFDVEADLRGYH